MFKLGCILTISLCIGYSSIAAGNGNSAYSPKSIVENNTSLPLIGIRINGGAKYTKEKNIEVEVKSLKTDKSQLEAMRIGFDPDLSTSNWEPYSEQIIRMQLHGEDGEKRIYAQLKDKAGNTSPIESNKIIYDTTPPSDTKISINKGEKFTNDKLGRVLINVQAVGADEIMLSNSPQFQNARWEPYKESVKWIIDVGNRDGNKVVFAKFRDFVGNESGSIGAGIILDINPPEGGTIQINNGDKYTRSKKLKLTLTSTDATKVRIVSRGKGKNYDFNPNASGVMEIIWITDSLQGVKSVKAYYMDEAKNTTKIPVEASIIVKTTPPAKALISIDQGKKHTNNAKGVVSVKLMAKEAPQNLKLLISNKPNFEDAAERDFTSSISNWQLDAETDGLKSIYVRLIDKAKNISEVAKADIFLDRSPPKIHSFVINNKSKWSIRLKVTLNCDVDDAYESQFSNNVNTLKNTKWGKYNEKHPDWTIMPGDGEKVVYGRFRDEAGNVSEIVSANIILDMTPPKGKLVIDEGRKVTNHPDGVVTLVLSHDVNVMGMQLANIPNFKEIKLLPIEETIENWKLGGENDGPKTVFLRLKDVAGNFSKIYSSGIILDRNPPINNELMINNNDMFVRNKNKRVAVSLRSEGASAMMISNKQSFEGGEWVPFKTATSWTLEGPEGIHYVHVKFKDAAGNESESISKMIKSDFTPPKIIKFTIDNDVEFCTNPQNMVALTFDVEDAKTMAISNNHLVDTGSFAGLWEPYQSNKEWTLDGEDGLKIVYGRFKDETGNVTHEHYDKIVLDRVSPTNGKISINNGAEWLTDKTGKGDIQLYAVGAHEFMISNTSDFAAGKWEPMAGIRKNWYFNTKNASIEVYAKFRDKAGNISEVHRASIKIDREPPKNASISIDGGAKYVSNKERKINIDTNIEGATKMRVSQNKSFRDVKWHGVAPRKEIILSEADGEKIFYAQFRDEAGNLSEIVSSKIILDTSSPVLNKFTIDEGADWTNHVDKKVTLSIDAEGANEMMIGDNPAFNNASWITFQTILAGYELPGEDGQKVLFIKLRDEAGNVSKIVTAKINLKRSF